MDTHRLIEKDDPSVRQLNRRRKKMKCLGCGKEFLTDRCHRICRMCRRRNNRNGNFIPGIMLTSSGV
jgi:hypothetical protein